MRVVALLLLLAGLLLQPGEARAHAALVATVPADGALLDMAPTHVTLTFGEAVSPLVLKLLTPDGRLQPLTDVRAERQSLIVHLPPDLGAGTSVLSWRVASEDGHPVSGTVSFSIGRIDAGAVAAANELRWPRWLARALALLGLLTAVGGAVFSAWIAPGTQPSAQLVRSALVLAFAALLTRFAADALGATGQDIAGLASVDLWRTPAMLTMAGGFAGSMLAVALAALSLRRPRRAARLLSMLALLLLGLVFAFSGHAATAAPKWLMQPAMALHIVGVAFWIGSLLPLLILAHRAAADLPDVLTFYAAPIVVAVSTLALAGTAIAAVQLGAVNQLWGSAYGLVLSIKLALLVALAGLAALNRFALTPRVRRGEPRALRLLGWSLSGEIALAVLIFGVVSLWQFTPPPRMAAAAMATPSDLHLHAHGGSAMANLVVTPARAGPVAIAISLMDVQWQPLDVLAVEIELRDPQGRIEPIRSDARRIDGSTWQIDRIAIPIAGSWQLQLNLLVSDFDKTSLRTTLDLPAP